MTTPAELYKSGVRHTRQAVVSAALVRRPLILSAEILIRLSRFFQFVTGLEAVGVCIPPDVHSMHQIGA
jgi:hypothetical protein